MLIDDEKDGGDYGAKKNIIFFTWGRIVKCVVTNILWKIM